MNGNRRLKRALMALVLLLVGALAFRRLKEAGAFLPGWICWEEGCIRDCTGQYEIRTGRRLTEVFRGGRPVWSSPKEVRVQKSLSCDIDHDGEDELVLLCWKKGRYGAHRPFWVKRDEKAWSQHLFVYEYMGDQIRPKWMSSYLGQEISDMRPDNLISPVRRLWLTSQEGEVSSWIWVSWGFEREDTDISFTVFGDNLIHEPIYRYGLQQEISSEEIPFKEISSGELPFDFLFENFTDVISQSDVAVINQETPLTDDPALYSDYPRFGTPVQVGEAITRAGFHVVTCATNHALDRGWEGVDFTGAFFRSKGILCPGIQGREEREYRPYEILERNGVRFALLNYTYGTNGIPLPEGNPHMVHVLEDEERIRQDIRRAKEEADLVILFVHWGTEYASEPDEFQKKWTQIFLEGHVDVVVGTHPHVLQPTELVRDESGHEMLVYYSIGNFISAQPEKSCVRGGMARFTVSLTQEGYRVTEYDLQPLTIVWKDGRFGAYEDLSGSPAQSVY